MPPDVDDFLDGHGGNPDDNPAADDLTHPHDLDYREAPGVVARFLLTHRDVRRPR